MEKSDEIIKSLSDKKAEKNFLKDEDLTEISNHEDSQNENLIFGQFKTMEEAMEAYTKAKTAAAQTKDIEKAFKQYQEQVEKDEIAREHGFLDRLEMALNYDVRQKELDNYLVAGSYCLSPQKRLLLNRLVEECRHSYSVRDLNEIRELFPSEVVALVSEDATLYKHIRGYEYKAMREQEKAARYKRQVDEFKKNNEAWANSEFNNYLINQAIELSDGHIDLSELKKIVEKIQAEAVRKYQDNLNAQQENVNLQDKLYVTDGENRSNGKKWLTKEEYYTLTPQQEAENYNLIVEQVMRENKGLLPRMLTKK